MSEHALLSASGASRWLNCTPSARLETKFAESAPSRHADEGTLAHQFAELMLTHALTKMEERVYKVELEKLRRHKLYDPFEMEFEVQKYVDLCLEAYNVQKTADPNTAFFIEKKVDYSFYAPNGKGVADFGVYGNGILSIMDLKYGKVVYIKTDNIHEVSGPEDEFADANQNPQIKLYGLGAMTAHGLKGDETINMTIVQPRLDNVSTLTMSAADLHNWGESIRPVAKKAFEGKGKQVAGDWCRWCDARGMCATLGAKMLRLADHQFRDPHLLSKEQVANIRRQLPMLKFWAKGVEQHILNTALRGEAWPGLKLVEGRRSRSWSDPDAVQRTLEDNLYAPDEYTDTKLLGITKLEKVLGEQFEPLVGKFVRKPSGKPGLAELHDPRPAMGIEQARIDFADPIEL